jgi:hypothetical protein
VRSAVSHHRVSQRRASLSRYPHAPSWRRGRGRRRLAGRCWRTDEQVAAVVTCIRNSWATRPPPFRRGTRAVFEAPGLGVLVQCRGCNLQRPDSFSFATFARHETWRCDKRPRDALHQSWPWHRALDLGMDRNLRRHLSFTARELPLALRARPRRRTARGARHQRTGTPRASTLSPMLPRGAVKLNLQGATSSRRRLSIAECSST